jgi:PAP2 superfamily
MSGRSSVVEHNLAKVGVESSNLFARSNFLLLSHLFGPRIIVLRLSQGIALTLELNPGVLFKVKRSAAFTRALRKPFFKTAWSATAMLVLAAQPALAAKPAPEVLGQWYKMALELTRHTATYTPPVASRTFAYMGVAAFEAVATGDTKLKSLAGQLNGLTPVPAREAGKVYDEAAILQGVMAHLVPVLYSNTGPTGQRVMATVEAKLRDVIAADVPEDVITRSLDYGSAVAAHILQWSKEDGGAVVENMGFPLEYKLKDGAANWKPTNLIAVQQRPLLPGWGNNRTFAMVDGKACPLPPPPAYSEDPSSEFFKEAQEVFDTKKNLTPEQRGTARFWSDDPMLSPTPPGHWVSIALQIMERDKTDIAKSTEVLAKLGVTLADAFIANWNTKFEYDLLRPVTYIRRTMDKTWESTMTTPPFPEYPSGHSTQSMAAAVVLTGLFGDAFTFEDATHIRDGVKARTYPNFMAAADEAGMSRLYGGIHFRAAIEKGLEQGQCVGAFTNKLVTRN